MAIYDFLLWSISDIGTTGPDPFADASDPNASVSGLSTLTIEGSPTKISLEDDDANFQEDDTSQLADGNQLDTEYSYIIRPEGSVSPADNITIFAVFDGDTMLGIVAKSQLEVGQTYDFVSAGQTGDTVAYPSLFVCYGPGTLIDTPDGLRAVERLQVGELVETLDHGPQVIRWIRIDEQDLKAVERESRPVLIAAGALGAGLPAQDLIVSPQHRIFVGAGGQLQDRFGTEAFVPAKSLTSLPGIRHMMGKQQITWIHFACDAHEIVFANSCMSESLLLGPTVLKGLTGAEQLALTDIFGGGPTPGGSLNGPPVRDCLTMGEVKRQLKKSHKEKKRRLTMEIRNWDLDLEMEQWEAELLCDAEPMGRIPIRRLH